MPWRYCGAGPVCICVFNNAYDLCGLAETVWEGVSLTVGNVGNSLPWFYYGKSNWHFSKSKIVKDILGH